MIRTVWHLTDPHGTAHTADTEDAFHELVARLTEQFGEDAELEGYATIETGPVPIAEPVKSILNEMQAAHETRIITKAAQKGDALRAAR